MGVECHLFQLILVFCSHPQFMLLHFHSCCHHSLALGNVYCKCVAYLNQYLCLFVESVVLQSPWSVVEQGLLHVPKSLGPRLPHIYIYILKGNVESRDTVLNTWEVELYKVIVEDGKLNYDFIPTSLFGGCPLISG